MILVSTVVSDPGAKINDLGAGALLRLERASAEAEQAWRAVSDALAQLEAEIRDAASG